MSQDEIIVMAEEEDAFDCTDICPVKVEVEEIERIYDSLSKRIYVDMNKQYEEGKISGPTYASTWAELMKAVVAGSIQGVVALQNKETAADRAVKREQVASSIIKSANETCIAESTCALNTAKTKAEDIKNGDVSDGTSLYGDNKQVLKSQKTLYDRQKAGFGDNARQKLLDSQISAWSIAWRDSDAIEVPASVQPSAIDGQVADVGNNIGQE